MLLRRDEEDVATGKFGLPQAELGRRGDVVNAGDASTDEFLGAVEPLIRLRVDLLRFPMPLFCPGRVPREFVPIMMRGTRLPLERGYRKILKRAVVVYHVVGNDDGYGRNRETYQLMSIEPPLFSSMVPIEPEYWLVSCARMMQPHFLSRRLFNRLQESS